MQPEPGHGGVAVADRRTEHRAQVVHHGRKVLGDEAKLAQAQEHGALYRFRFGASARSTSPGSSPLRSAMSMAWSGPILPTLK